MSRTVRKRVPDNYHYAWWIPSPWYTPKFHNPKDKIRAEAKNKADSDSGIYSLPKQFRRTVNGRRRMVDKTELHRSLREVDYIPNMSPWSCKDGNSWGYW